MANGLGRNLRSMGERSDQRGVQQKLYAMQPQIRREQREIETKKKRWVSIRVTIDTQRQLAGLEERAKRTGVHGHPKSGRLQAWRSRLLVASVNDDDRIVIEPSNNNNNNNSRTTGDRTE